MLQRLVAPNLCLCTERLIAGTCFDQVSGFRPCMSERERERERRRQRERVPPPGGTPKCREERAGLGFKKGNCPQSRVAKRGTLGLLTGHCVVHPRRTCRTHSHFPYSHFSNHLEQWLWFPLLPFWFLKLLPRVKKVLATVAQWERHAMKFCNWRGAPLA